MASPIVFTHSDTVENCFNQDIATTSVRIKFGTDFVIIEGDHFVVILNRWYNTRSVKLPSACSQIEFNEKKKLIDQVIQIIQNKKKRYDKPFKKYAKGQLDENGNHDDFYRSYACARGYCR